MSRHTYIPVNGARLLADVSGALFWPEKSTLVVADLHLEKGSSYGRSRRTLPPYDSAATLEKLADAVARHRPQRVVCLGDSFHDPNAADRLRDEEVQRLRELTAAHDWIWVAGNHDPAPGGDLGGRAESEVVIGGLVFRHEARAGGVSGGEVSGHYHPKAAVQLRGRRLSGRCFAGDGRRLILPAFGAYAGGLSVRDPAIRSLLAEDFLAYLLGPRGIYAYRGSSVAG